MQRTISVRILTLFVTAIVDDGTQRSQTDTAGDKQQILSFQTIVAVFRCRNGFHRKVLSQRTSDGDFLSNVHHVQPACQTAALLDRKFHEFLVCRRRCNGEHTFANARNGNHRTLTGHMLEQFVSVQTDHAECLDIGSILTNVSYHADLRNQCFLFHALPSPKVFMTFTMFMEIGQLFMQRPQPTQPNTPSLFAG